MEQNTGSAAGAGLSLDDFCIFKFCRFSDFSLWALFGSLPKLADTLRQDPATRVPQLAQKNSVYSRAGANRINELRQGFLKCL